jgi:hypothetical protein
MVFLALFRKALPKPPHDIQFFSPFYHIRPSYLLTEIDFIFFLQSKQENGFFYKKRDEGSGGVFRGPMRVTFTLGLVWVAIWFFFGFLSFSPFCSSPFCLVGVREWNEYFPFWPPMMEQLLSMEGLFWHCCILLSCLFSSIFFCV